MPENGDLRGKCEANYFHIYIYKDLPDANFSSYEDSLKGTFMHEYLHYIQFVNTPFGISMVPPIIIIFLIAFNIS